MNRLFGFFLGSTLTGAGVYYYVLEEYRVANELLTGDIYVRCFPVHPSPLHLLFLCYALALALMKKRGVPALVWDV